MYLSSCLLCDLLDDVCNAICKNIREDMRRGPKNNYTLVLIIVQREKKVLTGCTPHRDLLALPTN
ncbi:hypothetical protein GQX74_013057 [Glossina fuscipes]|nr:hypothetical protein GQX74_013057 [Glossina fuscipes]